MDVPTRTRRTASRRLIGGLLCGGLAIAGCSSEIGSSPSSRARSREYLAKESAVVKQKPSRKHVALPKGIKARVLQHEDGEP
jgi:hypothetical protein